MRGLLGESRVPIRAGSDPAHLHFELRQDDRTPFAPYPAILEAQQREQCSVGIGPWSTTFRSPTETATRFDELKKMTPSELDEVDAAELALLEPKQRGELDGLSLVRRIEALLYEDQSAATLERTGRDLDKVLDVIDALEQAGEIQ
jgi:hypothetical protein